MLFASISIVIIVAFAVGSYFYFQIEAEEHVRDVLLDQQRLLQQHSTESVTGYIASDLDRIAVRLELLAYKQPLQSGDLSGEQVNKLIKDALPELSKITPLDTLFVVDSNNRTANVADDKNFALIGTDLSGREYVKEVSTHLQPYIADTFFAPGSNDWRFLIAVPIIDSVTGEYRGLIGADVITSEFFAHYGNAQKAGEAQFIVAVDRDGDYMATGAVGILGKNIFGEEVQRTINANPAVNAMYRSVLSGKSSHAVFDVGVGERLATAQPVYFRGEQIMSVVLSTPTATIYSHVSGVLGSTSIHIFTRLIAVFAAIAVLLVFLARWNKSLRHAVDKRTIKLKETNEQLERANSVLSEYNVQLGNAFEMVVKANEQLEAHDKMQKEFINIAAHELRTPVQPLIAIAESIEASAKDREKIEVTKAELQMIIRNAKRLEKLSSEIIEASRIESKSMILQKETFDLNEKVENVVANAKSHAADKQLEIIVERPQEHVIIEGDKPRLFEVIWNLVYNAIKFTDSGTVRVRVEKQSDNVIVTVKDMGRGIDPEVIPRLFTKFSGRSGSAETGAGLGLYISKSIIEEHGGKIWGQNNPDGVGATFGFSLPLSRSQEAKHI